MLTNKKGIKISTGNPIHHQTKIQGSEYLKNINKEVPKLDLK